jgi:tetratricopeptide (TPR) repeat protein
MMVDGDYEGAAAAFEALGDYKDSAARAEQAREKMQGTQYDAAVALMEAGEFHEALERFRTMQGYEDADAYAAELESLIARQGELAGAKEQDIITFGSYEQDNKTENGAEPLEWIVIGTEDGALTLLSRYVIDVGPFNETLEDITWEDSSSRKWLTDSFVGSAFSEEEAKLLLLTTVPPHANPKFPVDYKNDPISAGNETNDRAWLLSEEEALALPASVLKAESTAFAKAGGATMTMTTKKTTTTYTFTIEDPTVGTAYWNNNQNVTITEETEEPVWVDHSGAWWLRTPGKMQNKAMYVGEAGRMVYEGYNVDFAQYGIRPVIRISVG